jgi:tetratricopeptide (TPR) repeat protein
LTDLDTLWDFQDPAQSEQRFRARLKELAEPTGLRVETQAQLARALGLQRRFDEGHAVLDDAEAALRSDWRRARVRVWLERGRLLNSARQGDRGQADFQRAFDEAEQAVEENLAIDAAHMLGIILPGDDGVAWNERALGLTRAATEPRARAWLGSLLNNLGWTYHDQGDFARALPLFEDALAFRLEQGDPGPVRIARWCVARCLRSLGRQPEALERQRALQAELTAAGETDGYVVEEIGENLLALGRSDEARPYFAEAHQRLSADPWLVEHEAARLERLRRLAGV